MSQNTSAPSKSVPAEQNKDDTNGAGSSSDEDSGPQRKDIIKMRLAELNEQDMNIANRTDSQFVKRKSVIDEEFKEKFQRLVNFNATELDSINRRTQGELDTLQNSTEGTVTDMAKEHNRVMFPSSAILDQEYVDAVKKYAFIDDEIAKKRKADKARYGVDPDDDE